MISPVIHGECGIRSLVQLILPPADTRYARLDARILMRDRPSAPDHPRIIVFAKAPVPGNVKTRLGLDPARAAALHRAFVSDTLEMLAPFANVELSTDIETGAWSEYPVARSLQAPGDLGAKLGAAIERALTDGHRPVLILGSDSPTLPPDHVQSLLGSWADIALGPAEDGGFYAISCRHSMAGMFREVVWSTPRTLATVVSALSAAGLSVEIGPAWFDVDVPADLERLALAPRVPRHTRSVCGSQLRRCSSSIPANPAEECERKGDP